MGPTRRWWCVVVLLTVVLAAGAVPTAAGRTTIDVAIDGTTVRDGETVTATDDPVVDIGVESNASVESVTVRVDGEVRHAFEPNATTVSEQVTLDLTDGEHTVDVGVEPGGRSLTATVRKDSRSPRLTYTSPFQSVGPPPTGTVTIDRANTTLAADLEDLSGVREVRIERRYEWQFGGRRRSDVTTDRIENPGDNVSQPILFGLGRNELRVDATDVHGQRHTHEFTIRVRDGEQPTIDLDRFERVGDRLHVAGTVSDNVKVRELSYLVGNSAQRTYVLNPTSPEPTLARVDADFEFTTAVSDNTESIILVATDVDDNTRRWEVPLDYRGHLTPTVTVDESATRVRDGGVEVVGSVVGGQVTRVVIESVAPDGTVVDRFRAYDGDATERVTVQGRVAAAAGETTVVIRAVDIDGRDHRASLTLPTPVEEPVTATSTPTATLTATPTLTPATTDADVTGTTGGRGALSDWAVAVGVLLGLLLVARSRDDAG